MNSLPPGTLGRVPGRMRCGSPIQGRDESTASPAVNAIDLPTRPNPTPSPDPDEEAATLSGLFAAYRRPILLTYGLFVLENVIRLAQPLAMGWAVADLLQSSPRGMLVFIGQCVLQMAITTVRHLYDTRTFGTIAADLAGDMVLLHRRQNVETSRVAARSALSRQLVGFFERELPIIICTLFSLVGAMALLAWYDMTWGLLCGGLLAFYGLFSRLLARRSSQLNQGIHDLQEQEVDVVERHDGDEVRLHFGMLRQLQVKLSDWHAVSFGVTDLSLVLFLGLLLLRWETLVGMSAGDLVAVIRYAVLFVGSLTNVPLVVQQLVRLADISQRLRRPAGVTAALQQS